MEIFNLGLLCAGGLLLLVAGGEFLTGGASRLAAQLGMRPIVIGLTIVAFGTSMPEAFVSIFASLEHKPDIAVANVVGSNIFNIAFILGLAAMIRPLKVEAGSIKREVPFVIGSAGLVWVLAYDRVLGRMDGLILVLLFFAFLWVCFRKASVSEESAGNPQKLPGSKVRPVLQIVFSLVLLVIGARLLLSGSVGLARLMGVSELLIGLTIVAAGTSLPELATSVIASFRAKDDIAVGNVTGSNIFNILFILGVSSLVYPLTISDTLLTRDIPLMAAVSLVSLPILRSGFVISRGEGLFLVLLYAGYTVMLVKAG